MSAIGKVILDTSVVVAALRDNHTVRERLRQCEELFVPLIVLGELEYGANLAAPMDRQRAAVQSFMESSTLLMPTMQTAAEYGRLKAALRAAGTPIPENDLWIAAQAIEQQWPLATRDAHFENVPGLSLFDWR